MTSDRICESARTSSGAVTCIVSVLNVLSVWCYMNVVLAKKDWWEVIIMQNIFPVLNWQRRHRSHTVLWSSASQVLTDVTSSACENMVPTLTLLHYGMHSSVHVYSNIAELSIMTGWIAIVVPAASHHNWSVLLFSYTQEWIQLTLGPVPPSARCSYQKLQDRTSCVISSAEFTSKLLNKEQQSSALQSDFDPISIPP